MHREFKLSGTPANGLFDISDAIFAYFISILKNQPESAPSEDENNWVKMLHQLSDHGMVPFLYSKISKTPKVEMPPSPVMHLMKNAFLASRAKSLRHEKQLSDIDSVFTKYNITYLVLKGPSIADTLYNDKAERPFSDIDILVPSQLYKNAKAALTATGYHCLTDRFSTIKNLHADETFVLKRSPKTIPVELHWSLTHFNGMDRTISYPSLFESSVEVKACNFIFRKLSPVNELVFASQHLTEHHNTEMRLIWIFDISLMASRLKAPEDWVLLQQVAQEWRSNVAVQNALQYAVAWTGLKLPKGFDDFSTWPKPDREEICFQRHLLKRHSSIYHMLKVRLPNPLPISLFFRYIFNFIFPPVHSLRKMYFIKTPLFIPYYHIRRWIDLFFKMTIRK